MEQRPRNPAGRRRALVLLGAVVVAAIAGTALLLGLQQAAGRVARVEVSPAAALLTSPGETRKLQATAYDAAGQVVDAAVTWSSSHAASVTIDGTGLATALADGSAQLIAEAGGVRSAPALAIVTRPAAGVTTVSDEQIVSGPVETDPEADPSSTNTYEVTVSGIRPNAGDRLIGTGETPLAGEVVAVSGDPAVLTMRLVPLPDLLPNLRIDEAIDLSTAPIEIPDEVARLYDVTRDGPRFTFTPKPNFNELLPSPGTADGRLPAGPVAALGWAPPLSAAGPQGTTAVYPFRDCDASFSPSSTSLPLQLSLPPAFSVEVKPSLQVTWTPADELERFVASASVKAKVSAGLKVTAVFEGKIACEITLYRFRIPVAGAVSLFLAGIVPVKAGFELAGRVTATTIEIGSEATADTSAELGIVCSAGGDCSVLREVADVVLGWKPRIDGPSVADVRFRPSLGLWGGIDLQIGSPFWKSLRFDVVKTKVGATLGADWAPRTVQILDTGYASSYRLTLDARASIGAKLGEIAKALGLGSIAAAELKISTDLARSPQGTLQLDKDRYVSGDLVSATITLDQADLEFLGLYQPSRVLLVRYTGGTLTEVDSAPASAGQREFHFSFTAQDAIDGADLFAFLVTAVAPLDFLALELGKGPAPSPSPSPTPTPTAVPTAASGTIKCAGDPTTIRSIADDVDKIAIIFDIAASCSVLDEESSRDDDPNIVLRLDTDPNETLWDGDRGDAGFIWSGGGEGDGQAPGTYTFEVVHVPTGATFLLTFTVDLSLIGGGPDVTMTVRDVSMTPVS